MSNKKNKKTNLPLVETAGELTVHPAGPEPNGYMIDISRKIKITKLITILVLVIFLLSMIMIFRKDITLENYQKEISK